MSGQMNAAEPDLPRGADLLARSLEANGVSRVFTLSGNHIMPIFDALLATNIEIIHVRHEAAAVHMADAWGRLTGEPGVALVTGGQGHSNAVAALYTALASESPLVLLSGHAGLDELGRGAFQEMPQADLARPVTKASWTASSAVTLCRDVTDALRLAKTGRPGPVHVSLPVDLLNQRVSPASAMSAAAESVHPEAQGDPRTLSRVLAELHRAKRPLVVCGPAICTPRGRAAMREAASALGVPVVGMESPRGIQDPSLGALAEVLGQADLLVLVGKPLDFTLRFGVSPALAGDCKLIVLDPDLSQVARAARGQADRFLFGEQVGSASAALTSLSAAAESEARRDSSWAAFVEDALAYRMPDWASARAREPGRLHPVELCRAVQGFMDEHPDATLVCDGGEIGQWPQALVRTERRLINGVAGTIGVSLPFAMAAKSHRPEHPVVAVMGDGTFGFHMAELDTALRHGLPVIVVIGNDARWNAEYQIQLRSYGPERAKHCDLLPARYDQVAEALGGFGALVCSEEDLAHALRRAYASGKPAVINVMIESVPAPVVRRPSPHQGKA